ncbi:ISAs1 family transposase [Kitasatospora sp. NA04385]|uniref:ISAs1 family transposase n=1 Tax=Kitasatospora sp. NA04385 TaxID=2742135 RepID=UPI0015900A19|nr:ISAs1 family transposase [Kitasatospora sp. NA04385]QKW20937.1 ISAs1 family transposase [Kitasatospora sp. NA04385]
MAVDGKATRGSRHGTSPAAHLLAAMTGDGRTVTQLRIPGKTNEITCFAALLEPFDLAGVTVTADALHTQRAHARFLVEEKKAHYLLVVKANQPELHRRLRSLPWKNVTARRYDREIGHGRRETRATRALTVTDLGLDFPHAAQAVRILRHRTDLMTGRCSRQTVYAITDPTSQEASPQRLGSSPDRSGPSRTGSTSSATPPSPRMPRRSVPATARSTWPPCAASRSTPSAPPGTATSPSAFAKPPTRHSTARSTCWASPDQHTYKIARLCNIPSSPGSGRY